MPNGRSFTTSAEPKVAVLSKGRSSTANSGTKVAVLLGINRRGRFPCFPYPTLSLASELAKKKTWKYPSSPNVEVRRVDLANWALRTSPKFTIGVKYQFHQGFFFIRSKIRKSQSPFSPQITKMLTIFWKLPHIIKWWKIIFQKFHPGTILKIKQPDFMHYRVYIYHHHDHHRSILPKGRSLTANSGTKVAVRSKTRSSITNPGTKVAV